MALDNCPCTGKNMSNLAAPWILLTLYRSEGIHGYEICKIIRERIGELGVGLNITGLYRHSTRWKTAECSAPNGTRRPQDPPGGNIS